MITTLTTKKGMESQCYQCGAVHIAIDAQNICRLCRMEDWMDNIKFELKELNKRIGLVK